MVGGDSQGGDSQTELKGVVGADGAIGNDGGELSEGGSGERVEGGGVGEGASVGNGVSEGQSGRGLLIRQTSAPKATSVKHDWFA